MAASAGESVGEAAPSAPTSESEPSRRSSPAGPPQRHYPLDTHLPFDRYEHRLTARDVMVHRIMNKFMHPEPALAKAFEHYVRFPSDFRHIARVDTELAADLSALNKMLTTGFLRGQLPPHKPLMVPFPSDHAECCGVFFDRRVVEGPRPQPPRLKDQVVDMVKRHYFERDNAALRAWITSLSSFPYPGTVAPRYFGFGLQNRGDLPPRFELRVSAKNDNWTAHETEHLRKLRPQLAIQNQLPLYDGGVFTSQLRRRMDGRALNGSRRGAKNNRWMTRNASEQLGATSAWPGEYGTMRFFISSHWEDHAPDAAILSQYPHYKLDVSTNAYRGRNRDGIWSTGQGTSWSRRNREEGRYGRPRRRCTSEPPPGTFTRAFLGALEKAAAQKLVLTFPDITVSELDRRSRRRSLSRTRIQEMFDWDVDLAAISAPASLVHTFSKAKHLKTVAHCENCGIRGHNTSDCAAPCGHCGAPNPNHRINHFEMAVAPENWPDNDTVPGRPNPAHHDRHREPHIAPDCPVLRQNRCKCLPFPFHIAARCGIPCRRDCGRLALASPGSYQHRNAMLCRARCCMCGLKGHSGKECKLRRCRCGGVHLGQDCSWKPECRVPGCGRYWCGVHCRECGGVDKPFVHWRCTKCVGDGLKDAPEEEVRGRRRRRRRRPADEKGQAAKDGSHSGTGAVAFKTAASSRISPSTAPQPQASKEPLISIFGGPRVPRDAPTRDGLLAKNTTHGRQDDSARHG